MGGRGSAGGGSAGGRSAKKSTPPSVFGNEAPIEFVVEYNRKRGYWKRTLYEANKTDQDGEINIGYARADEYRDVSKSFVEGTFEIKQGLYYEGNKLVSHNINWQNVRSIAGKTYDIRDFIREQGFKWDREKKRWIK